ncbi:4a-hydroxytetrahydrobiopterin dehydratase [Merismopedia glauca]|uniref:Putative pterin-4-alpha-carbinolamine dehydratase n=1 Tax=Merismopedia glauca CCAP 1448/3 TaxID=1296344 RepID=A0A2T1C1B8_9CYAN|nr:4a-hydroxytetrahydrobiopterin dehydratase [Merismopedia glauca]PSB02075.1 4a-hydroxytetrahydrobiopterin dehydratase [Merismopedia glauca CCAP 1448/3]
MQNLGERKCVACSGNSPGMTEAEITELKPQIPEWEIIQVNGEQRLERIYKFPNFESALHFTNQVGAIAETEGHHPALLTEWGKVTVTWWTHAISGLHQNDFIMAAKTDNIAATLAQK